MPSSVNEVAHPLYAQTDRHAHRSQECWRPEYDCSLEGTLTNHAVAEALFLCDLRYATCDIRHAALATHAEEREETGGERPSETQGRGRRVEEGGEDVHIMACHCMPLHEPLPAFCLRGVGQFVCVGKGEKAGSRSLALFGRTGSHPGLRPR